MGQELDRYVPLNRDRADLLTRPMEPQITRSDPENVGTDDRVLVERLEAIVFIDSHTKIVFDHSIDDLVGVHHRMDDPDSLVFEPSIRWIAQRHLGTAITLRNVNQLAADIAKQYRACGMPVVDVQIPEQRVTTGTLHVVVIEARVGKTVLHPGDYFSADELSRWTGDTRSGQLIRERTLGSDLMWLNRNPFRRVTVDFESGDTPGTTDVHFRTSDVYPLRGYIGVDDSGVQQLNYGRLFAGLTYGNLFGKGGLLGYQYTTDEAFDLFQAHAVSYLQPINRRWSWQSHIAWAEVTPDLGPGLTQRGESWQTSASWVRHLKLTEQHQMNCSFGFEFKSTNNNLAFSGTTVADSEAELAQIRVGFDSMRRRQKWDDYRLLRADVYVGPGDGMTSSHNRDAFNSIRPGSSPDYVYGRFSLTESFLIGQHWQSVNRFVAQASSERLLYSETLGLGGYDSVRGFDQRSYNADHGWFANFELGPRTLRWGGHNEQRVLRAYGFIDLGNGYIDSPLPGEDAYTFVMSSGVGARFQISDRLSARVDYGAGVLEMDNAPRSSRFHFGLTWIPGPRP